MPAKWPEINRHQVVSICHFIFCWKCVLW